MLSLTVAVAAAALVALPATSWARTGPERGPVALGSPSAIQTTPMILPRHGGGPSGPGPRGVGLQLWAPTGSTPESVRPLAAPAVSTLVLRNETLEAGNVRPANGVFPEGLAPDPSNGTLYVTEVNSANVTVINATEGVVVGSVPVGAGPDAVAYDASNGDLYVVDGGSDNVTVINATHDRVVGSIPTGVSPFAIGWDSATNEVFVANFGSNNVTVIDGGSNTIVRSVPTGPDPNGVACDPANGRVYVSDFFSANLTVINASSDTVAGSVAVGAIPDAVPVGVVYDASDRDLYVGDVDGQNVTIVSTTAERAVGSIGLPAPPTALAFDPSTGDVYATLGSGAWDSDAAVINTTSRSVVGRVPVGDDPEGVAYDPAVGDLYVTNRYTDNLTVIDGATQTVAGSIVVGVEPTAVAYAGAGDTAVVTQGSTTLLVLNGSTAAVVASAPVGVDSRALAYDPVSGALYVVSYTNASVAVVNASTGAALATIPGGYAPLAVAYDRANDCVYVAEYGLNSVEVIDASTPSFVERVPVGSSPDGVAYDAGDGDLYVANYDSANLTVINGSTNRAATAVALGGIPTAVAYDPVTGAVYASLGNDTVAEIPAGTDRVAEWIPVGDYPVSIAVDPANGGVYVADENSNNLTVIDGTTDRVVGSIPVGLGPVGVAYDRWSGALFVANDLSGTVSIITPASTFPVRLVETGLPVGTPWSVVVPGAGAIGSTTAALGLASANGTVDYAVTTADPTYAAPPGSFTVEGASVAASVVFHTVTYAITITEQGLPSGTPWTLSIADGPEVTGTTPSLALSLTNGSYTDAWRSEDPDYSGSAGAFTVDGAGLSENAAFAPVTYPVTFTAEGLPAGIGWWVNGTGIGTHAGSGATITFDAANGTYPYTLSVANKSYAAAGGSFTVGGAAVPQPAVFSLVTYALSFTETGLPAGTGWSVTAGGTQRTSVTDAIEFVEPNGTFAYTVGDVTGYSVDLSAGHARVRGTAVTEPLAFTGTPPPASPRGGPSEEVSLALAGGTLIALAAVLLRARHRSPPPSSKTGPGGTNEQGT